MSTASIYSVVGLLCMFFLNSYLPVMVNKYFHKYVCLDWWSFQINQTNEVLLVAGLRILVTLLLDTLPMLGNVLLLCFFVFFIFGIIGVQLWSGLLRNRCFLDLPANVSVADLLVCPHSLTHSLTHSTRLTYLNFFDFLLNHTYRCTLRVCSTVSP